MRKLLAALVACPLMAVAGSYEDGLNAAAERELGFMYYDGRGFKQDIAQAVRWFERAAAHGDLESQVNLGKMYENGLSVAQDDAKSAYWFRMAAEQGDRRAQLRFGEICYLGNGVARDKAEAVKWWHLATEADDALSSRLRSMVQATLVNVPADVADEGRKRAREWRAQHEKAP